MQTYESSKSIYNKPKCDTNLCSPCQQPWVYLSGENKEEDCYLFATNVESVLRNFIVQNYIISYMHYLLVKDRLDHIFF